MDLRDTPSTLNPYGKGVLIVSGEHAIYVEGPQAEPVGKLITSIPTLWAITNQIQADLRAMTAEAVQRSGGGAVGEAIARQELGPVFERLQMVEAIISQLS